MKNFFRFRFTWMLGEPDRLERRFSNIRLAAISKGVGLGSVFVVLPVLLGIHLEGSIYCIFEFLQKNSSLAIGWIGGHAIPWTGGFLAVCVLLLCIFVIATVLRACKEIHRFLRPDCPKRPRRVFVFRIVSDRLVCEEQERCAFETNTRRFRRSGEKERE